MGNEPGAGQPVRLGSRVFAGTDLAVLAIVNRTPDPFSDRGATSGTDEALAAVDRAVALGADLVDVGGIPAGPGGAIDEDDETRLIVPFVRLVRESHPALVISVHTWRAGVAERAVAAGADLLTGARAGADPALAEVAAATGAALVCSYRPAHADVVGTVRWLADRAVDLGVRPDGILVDPAHDLGGNAHHSPELTRRLDELAATGWPVLVALSTEDLAGEAPDRLTGTLAATVVSAQHGARFFRTHQVRETRQALDMLATIRGDRPPVAARRGLA